MESELGKRTTFLDNLPKFLSTLEAASEPLNEFMSAPAANPADQAALYQRSKQLPLPLYVLFTQLEGFRSAFHSADKSFSVQISSARKPDSKQVATPRAGKREDQEPRSRHSADDDEVEEDIDPLLPEGHTVSLSLSFQGTKKTGSKKRSRGGAPGSAQPATQAVDISIEFSYVKAIGVVCVKTTCSTLQDRLLDSLFPGDDGKGPPSASAAALLSSVAPSRTTHAPAYKWAQWLAGIKCLPLASSATPGVPAFTEPTMAQWFAAVRSRITARQLLQAHLSVLSSDSASWKAIPVHPSFAGRFPSGIKTAVASWQEVDEVDEKYTKLLDQSGDFDCFETVYRVNKSHALTIVVAVPVDYPQSAPTFRVVLPEGEPFDNDIDSAEREVNDYSQELVGAEDSRNHLLVHQARRLAMCLDIVYEKESKRHTTNYGRRRRGRDRRLPLVYDWESKSFVHR